MSIVQALVLGIVQGLTEFLPVSSSGHQIVAGRILGLSYVPLGFELVTHLATLLAVVIAMRKQFFSLVKRPLQKMNLNIIVATVPTVIIFLTFRNFFEGLLDGHLLALCFVITAILLWISSMIKHKNTKAQIGILDAAIIGISQGVAGMPGISRSGATIATAKLLGQSQESAAHFSFLISIPIIIGASLWEFIGGGFSFGIAVIPAIVGAVASFTVGFLAISLFLKLIKKIPLGGFSIYLIALAVFMVLNDFVFRLF